MDFKLELLIVVAIAILLFLATSCSWKTLAPTGGAVVGGGLGALGGNPATAMLGAGVGAGVGQIVKESESNDKVDALVGVITKGDVEGLLEQQLEEHQSGFTDFVDQVQKIMIICACCMGVYLLIPVFITRKCQLEAKKAKESATRAPFRGSRPSYPHVRPKEQPYVKPLKENEEH